MSTEQATLIPPPLAQETRARFVSTIERAIAPAAHAVRERLITLANQPGNARDSRQSHDDLIAFSAQEPNWVALAHKGWREALSDSRPGGGAVAPTQSRLELIDDEVVENQILSSRLVLAIEDQAGAELHPLRLRIQHLEKRGELAGRDVLRPEVLSRLLVDQWLAAGLTRALWNKVRDTLQPRIAEAALAACQEANAFLIGQGVMPEIDLKGLVRRAQGAPASASAPLAGGLGALHSKLGAVAPAGPGGAPVQLAAGSPLAAARQRAQSVLGNLKRFVAARIGSDFAAAADSADAARSPPFADAIDEAGAAYQAASSRYAAGGGVAVLQQSQAELRRRANELKRKATTTADKATVEIVALMFQAILSEERIPFSARVWFARLQMPVLRVAIAEPEFFGSLQHPARMLIDRMGSCVMGFDAAAISGSALEGEIRRVVQVIEQYPETGQRVFKLVYDEFVAFLSRYLTKSDATQRVMSVAQQVEQKETMAIQYTIELRKMLNDIPVREEIGAFLFKVWAEVLALAALRYGAQDEKTITLKRAASDLVWAASAKPGRADRARVIQDLPGLLARLREGMALLGITGAPQDEHIRAIGATLADAFVSKTEAIAPAQIDAMAQRLAHLEDFVGDEGADALPLDAASIELLLGVDAASIEVVPDTDIRVGEEMLAWARELQVGSWFLLDHNARASQVQFVWHSQRKQLHLFATTDGRSFLIQVGRLASYLQAGLLVPAEEEMLTVRATREALAKLDANPERLLN